MLAFSPNTGDLDDTLPTLVCPQAPQLPVSPVWNNLMFQEGVTFSKTKTVVHHEPNLVQHKIVSVQNNGKSKNIQNITLPETFNDTSPVSSEPAQRDEQWGRHVVRNQGKKVMNGFLEGQSHNIL